MKNIMFVWQIFQQAVLKEVKGDLHTATAAPWVNLPEMCVIYIFYLYYLLYFFREIRVDYIQYDVTLMPSSSSECLTAFAAPLINIPEMYVRIFIIFLLY